MVGGPKFCLGVLITEVVIEDNMDCSPNGVIFELLKDLGLKDHSLACDGGVSMDDNWKHLFGTL